LLGLRSGSPNLTGDGPQYKEDSALQQ
jgi:hypothetical protein